MNKEKFYIYRNAILDLYPTAWNFSVPKNTGAQNNVIYATVANKDIVFKFADKALVEKNEAVSKLYKMRGIPVPEITARCKNGLYFEEYQKIQGISLFEAIQRGMPPKQIKRVYRDILVYFEIMSRIHPTYLNSNFLGTVHDVAKINVTNVNGSKVANLFKFLVYLLNLGFSKSIYHSDIIPKNIIVDKNGNFSSFIDVDSVNICSKEYAFAMMAAKYREIGFDVSELLDCYKNCCHDDINTAIVSKYVNLLYGGKRMLWKLSQKKKTK